MRYLKKKVQLRQESSSNNEQNKDKLDALLVKTEPDTESIDTASLSRNSSTVKEYALPLRKSRQTVTSSDEDSKNIIKNYGKALCSFAASKMAVPYLKAIIIKKNFHTIQAEQFISFIREQKDVVNNIESLRGLLIVGQDDSEVLKMFKDLFKEISVVFLKFFAVNWIYNGRLKHKKAHMKYRFSMLRRVRNPEHFTYLKTSAR